MVVDVQTGEVTQVELTDEEVTQTNVQYAVWLAEQPLEPEQEQE
jgi:hypothetical protein